jgi:hypothetical protein
MVRPSFGHVVLATTASLAIACGNAYADTAATPPESDTATAPHVPQEGSTPTLSGGTSPDEGTPTGDELATESEESVDVGTQDVLSSGNTVQPHASVTVGDSAAVPAGSPAGGAPPAPPPQNTADATAKQQIDETSAAPSGPPPAAASPIAPGASSSTPRPGQPPAPVAPAAPRTGPLAQPDSTPEPTKAGGSLEELLTKVGRELRTAQGQIEGLQRGLDRGAPPSPDHVSRLRATLVRITPMLAALEVRLEAAGRLSPHLQQLLHGVQSDLRGVRATAAGLVAALRHSRATGEEVQLLLQELESFQGLGSTLASTPGANPARPAPATTSPADPQPWTAPATSSVPASTVPPHPRADDRRESPSRGGGGPSAESVPSSASPGAATASPGGSFSFTAAVALTMALIGLALPALLTRLDLPPGRRYAVALIAPLERPG